MLRRRGPLPSVGEGWAGPEKANMRLFLAADPASIVFAPKYSAYHALGSLRSSRKRFCFAASRAASSISTFFFVGEPHTRLRLFCSPHHQDTALYPSITQLERATGFRRDDTDEHPFAAEQSYHQAIAVAKLMVFGLRPIWISLDIRTSLCGADYRIKFPR
jgi:hypothetical protein